MTLRAAGDHPMHNYATHLPVLAERFAYLLHPLAPVAEIGGGYYSTPLFAAHRGPSLTIEPDDDWRARLQSVFPPHHGIVGVDDGLAWIAAFKPVFVFIDSDPRPTRPEFANRVAPYTDCIIVHDWHSTKFEVEGFEVEEVHTLLKPHTATLLRAP